MVFILADTDKENEVLNALISENGAARKTHEDFLARIALQQMLIQTLKAEKADWRQTAP